ncbi:MAG TPA: hypothetical protein VFN65_13295 [Solirubrobacteraceae bacterium]|nr:hypothetical protein [Solirubrobacteraceae bacterium]
MPVPSRRFLTRALLAAILGPTAVFTAACGSSGSDKGLLTAAESRTISSALSAVSSAVRAHSCSRARTAVNALNRSLQNLPAGTNPKLVHNLGHGATTVGQLASTECAPRQKPRTTTTSTSTTATTTVTTTQPTTTQTTQTTPSVPTTNTTPSTTPATTPSTPAPTPTTGAGAGNGQGAGGTPGGGGGGAGLTGGGNSQ